MIGRANLPHRVLIGQVYMIGDVQRGVAGLKSPTGDPCRFCGVTTCRRNGYGVSLDSKVCYPSATLAVGGPHLQFPRLRRDRGGWYIDQSI